MDSTMIFYKKKIIKIHQTARKEEILEKAKPKDSTKEI